MAPWPLEDHSGSWQPALGVSSSLGRESGSTGIAMQFRSRDQDEGEDDAKRAICLDTPGAAAEQGGVAASLADAGMAAAVVARHTTAPSSDDDPHPNRPSWSLKGHSGSGFAGH